MLDEVARARGRKPFTLGVQVLESLYLNLLAGLEPKAWVAAGWIDFLIQCDFNCTNPQLPVGEFAEFCRPSGCTHHVRMGNMMGGSWSGKPYVGPRSTAAYKNNPSYGGMVLTPEEARGAAANIYGFGADGVGLWNICCNLGEQHKAESTGKNRGKFQEDMMAWIEAVQHPDKIWSEQRVYHYLPLYKREALPLRNYPVNALLQGPTGWLTQIVTFGVRAVGLRQVFRFLCADGERQYGGATAVARWRILGAVPEDAFAFDLNGSPLVVDVGVEDDDELPALAYEAELSIEYLQGESELGMILEKRAEAQRPWGDPYMEALEITIEP